MADGGWWMVDCGCTRDTSLVGFTVRRSFPRFSCDGLHRLPLSDEKKNYQMERRPGRKRNTPQVRDKGDSQGTGGKQLGSERRVPHTNQTTNQMFQLVQAQEAGQESSLARSGFPLLYIIIVQGKGHLSTRVNEPTSLYVARPR